MAVKRVGVLECVHEELGYVIALFLDMVSTSVDAFVINWTKQIQRTCCWQRLMAESVETAGLASVCPH